jgi:hypothetical protein
MPAAPIIIGAAVAGGAAAAIGAAAVGVITAATVSTAVATAVGVGIISGGITAVQGGKASDVLRSAVLGGVGSYVGGQVASRVTSAVAQQTGASLVDLEPALRGLSGEGASAAGVAAITAGNVAGQAATAAITGAPIEQAALFGLAQSVPTALTSSQDFRSLNPVVQNVLASSAQAAVMGQDVGDAAIASLVASSGIVARAIKEIPGGEQFIQQNPIYAKYVIDSVSSALTAQLQGKDVSESVLYSLARTTADVLSDKFKDAQAAKEVQEANNAYNQAQQEQQNIEKLVAEWEQEQKKYSSAISNYDSAVSQYNSAVQNAESSASLAQYYADQLNDPNLDRTYRENADAQRKSLQSFLNQYNKQTEANNKVVQRQQDDLRAAEKSLRRSGFFDAQARYEQQINDAVSRFEALTALVNQGARTLTENSSNLFIDFETELATTLAPLTAFEETDVTDQDLMAEISPVAPPTELAQGPIEDQDLLNQIQEVAARPDVGVPADATQLAQAPQTLPEVVVTPGGNYQVYYSSPDQSTLIIEENNKFYLIQNNQETEISVDEAQRLLDEFGKNAPVGGGALPFEGSLADEFSLEELLGGGADLGADQTGGGAGTQITAVSPPSALTGATGAGAGAGIGAETGAGIGAGTDMAGFEAGAVGGGALPTKTEPSFTTLFNYLTRGGGSPYAENKAVFDVEGGFGSSAGSGETTFKLITIIRDTGEEVYDVGGKTYTLMTIPEIRRQVLVPTEPSPTILYVEPDQFNRPKFVETSIAAVPPREADLIANKIQETENVAGGAPTGAEGAAGGLTAERPSTTTPTEQLQPGVRPEDVAPGVSAEAPAPSFPDLISGITEPTVPAPVPGADAGFEDALQAPGAGGVGDEITDEDIIRIIQGEMGEAGGGEGEGLPGEEGAGPGEGEEGAGPGAGEEGEGEGAGGEGEGTGEGVGPGTGEGGTPETQLPQPSPDIVPTITTVGRRTFARPAEGAPYRVTGMDESGILGRKQPLFGGDEDLQRAEWNRRSLRLRRLLGL